MSCSDPADPTRRPCPPVSDRSRTRRRGAARLAWLVPLLIAVAAPAPQRGDPASRIGDGDTASEYWDLSARFDSGHHLFVRFLITNEGPGERTGVSYGHFIRPDGRIDDWDNGRRQQNWTLGPRGLLLDIGTSDLDLREQPYRLRIHKKRVDIDLRIAPEGPAIWDSDASESGTTTDLLANSAPIRGTVFIRDMSEPLELVGRASLTHVWNARSEAHVALRRLDFFSLGDSPSLHLRDFEAPDGARSRWLVVAQDGKTLFESNKFSISPQGGRSDSQQSDGYPIPETLTLSGPLIRGQIKIKAGLLHHNPLEDIPQPFRFLLSLSMRPHRVWAESPFEVTVGSGPDELKIRGTGLTTVTYLNPPPPPQL
jgi:hypothetical protein